MRPSLTDTKTIEKYLLDGIGAAEATLFQARLEAEPMLKANVFFQRQVYKLLRYYHRKKLKEEVSSVHDQLFSRSDRAYFQQKIKQIFNEQTF